MLEREEGYRGFRLGSRELRHVLPAVHGACYSRAIEKGQVPGTWCHILPGMLSSRLLRPMEYLVRARLLRALEDESREAPLHGWSILLAHALYKFRKVHTKDTDAGSCPDALEFDNYILNRSLTIPYSSSMENYAECARPWPDAHCW